LSYGTVDFSVIQGQRSIAQHLENLKKAPGSTRATKRLGRGQGSGLGKTAGRGGKGQTARTGSHEKRGFEGGQQPIQRRLPKAKQSSSHK